MALYECLYIRGPYSATAQNAHLTSSKAVACGKAKYILPAALLTVASILTSLGTDSVRSTYICPQFARKIVPFLQIVGALIDSFVLVSIENVIRRMKANNATADAAVPKVVGSVLVVSRLFLGRLLVLTSRSYRLDLSSLVASSL